MKKFKFILIPLLLLLFSTQCEEDIINPTYEEDQKELQILKAEIEDLANKSICGETYQCKFIAFGSKACGGPKSYLVYSTSINTENLESLIENYNQKESDFNDKWNVFSDCSIVNPPSDVTCENNTCVAVY